MSLVVILRPRRRTGGVMPGTRPRHRPIERSNHPRLQNPPERDGPPACCSVPCPRGAPRRRRAGGGASRSVPTLHRRHLRRHPPGRLLGVDEHVGAAGYPGGRRGRGEGEPGDHLGHRPAVLQRLHELQLHDVPPALRQHRQHPPVPVPRRLPKRGHVVHQHLQHRRSARPNPHLHHGAQRRAAKHAVPDDRLLHAAGRAVQRLRTGRVPRPTHSEPLQRDQDARDLPRGERAVLLPLPRRGPALPHMAGPPKGSDRRRDPERRLHGPPHRRAGAVVHPGRGVDAVADADGDVLAAERAGAGGRQRARAADAKVRDAVHELGGDVDQRAMVHFRGLHVRLLRHRLFVVGSALQHQPLPHHVVQARPHPRGRVLHRLPPHLAHLGHPQHGPLHRLGVGLQLWHPLRAPEPGPVPQHEPAAAHRGAVREHLPWVRQRAVRVQDGLGHLRPQGHALLLRRGRRAPGPSPRGHQARVHPRAEGHAAQLLVLGRRRARDGQRADGHVRHVLAHVDTLVHGGAGVLGVCDLLVHRRRAQAPGGHLGGLCPGQRGVGGGLARVPAGQRAQRAGRVLPDPQALHPGLVLELRHGRPERPAGHILLYHTWNGPKRLQALGVVLVLEEEGRGAGGRRGGGVGGQTGRDQGRRWRRRTAGRCGIAAGWLRERVGGRREATVVRGWRGRGGSAAGPVCAAVDGALGANGS